MTDEKKTFAGQGRAIRNLCEVVLALTASPDPLDLNRAKQLAQSLLDSVPRKRGNPAIHIAQLRGGEHSRNSSIARRSIISEAIRKLRADGAKTYVDLAEGLNEKGIKPHQAEKWTANMVSRFDPDRDQK